MENQITPLLMPKQKLFCDEYLKYRNATRAALEAGYSQDTAKSGYLMTIPKIRLYLDQQMEHISQEAQVTQVMVIKELCKIAFGNMGNYYLPDGRLKPMGDLSDDEKAALWSVSPGDSCNKSDSTAGGRVKMHNKLAAIKEIAKMMQFYTPVAEKPKTVYVYLDKKQLDENDRFEDNTFDIAEQQQKAAELKKKAEDEYVYNERDGQPAFESPLPYGPMAEVFAFDIHDKPEEVVSKLKTYEGMQAGLAGHALAHGAGEAFETTDIRRQLGNWIELELWQLGTSGHGATDTAICNNFERLRRMTRSRIEHGTFVKNMALSQMPERLKKILAEWQGYRKESSARMQGLRPGIPTNTDMLVA